MIEFLQRKPLARLGMIFTPIITLFAVPFLRPFRCSWLLWFSLIPFFILWDGTVSVMRVRNEDELLN